MNQSQIDSIIQQHHSNIQAALEFYNLTFSQLIHLVADQKFKRKIFTQQNQQLFLLSNKFKLRVNKYASKSFQKVSLAKQILNYYSKKKAASSKFLKIIKLKLKKQMINNQQTRRNIWLLATNARMFMEQLKDYYKQLKQCSSYPNYFNKYINLDVNRTLSIKQNIQQAGNKLTQILQAFSKRNPYIGYCQGLNFIVLFLIKMGFTNQECFWLLSMIIECILPIEYYTNMYGMVCDQKIFKDLVGFYIPKLYKKLEKLQLDSSVFTIQWFVCVYTSTLPFKVCNTYQFVCLIWDKLLIQKQKILFKVGLGLLRIFEQQMLKAKQFSDLILTLQNGLKNIECKVNLQLFLIIIEQFYISNKGLRLARDIYKSYYLIEKLNLDKKTLKKKQKKNNHSQEVDCNSNWPICIQAMQKIKRNKTEQNIWTFRHKKLPKIVKDYWDKPNLYSHFTDISQQRYRKISRTDFQLVSNEEGLLIGRFKHICRGNGEQSKENCDGMIELKQLGRIESEQIKKGQSFLVKENGEWVQNDMLRWSSSYNFYTRFMNQNKI